MVLTDQTTEFCRESADIADNVARAHANDDCAVHVVPLSWGSAHEVEQLRLGEKEKDADADGVGRFDVVIVSDCICHQDDEVMQKLVWTIDALLKTKSKAKSSEKKETGASTGEGDEVEDHEPVALVAYEYRDDWFTCETFMAHVEAFGFSVKTKNLDPDDDESDYLLYELRRK